MKKRETTEAEERILSDSDLEIIRGIAEKYKIRVSELGRILSRRSASYPKTQILLTTDEMYSIDRKAKELNLNRSKYCTMCVKKAMDEKIYEDIDIMKVIEKSKSGRREHRAMISYDSSSGYIKIKKLANDLGVPFSSLIRYFALNVEL